MTETQLPFGIYDLETGEIVLNGYGFKANIDAAVKPGQGVKYERVRRNSQRVDVSVEGHPVVNITP